MAACLINEFVIFLEDNVQSKEFDAKLVAEIKGYTGAATDHEVIEALAVCDGNKENTINYIMN